MPSLIPRHPMSLRRLAILIAVLGYAFAATFAAAASPPLDRWEQLRAQDLRVARIAYRLSVLNAGLCPNALAPQPGFVLHSIDQYDLVDRQGAARSFGLGSYVGVMAVVAGSPAQRSGLAADDQIVAVNGRALTVADAAAVAAPNRTAVAFAQSILATEMAKGEVVLRISRAGAIHDVRFTANAGCASNVELVTGGEVNAWADGQRVVVSDGIVAHCDSDGALALVIGHEFAHNLLHHSERLAAAGSANRRLSLTGTGSAGMRKTEEEADRLGVRLASGASYDLSNALPFVADLLGSDGAVARAGTHPAPARRLALLKAEIAAAQPKLPQTPA